MIFPRRNWGRWLLPSLAMPLPFVFALRIAATPLYGSLFGVRIKHNVLTNFCLFSGVPLDLLPLVRVCGRQLDKLLHRYGKGECLMRNVRVPIQYAGLHSAH